VDDCSDGESLFSQRFCGLEILEIPVLLTLELRFLKYILVHAQMRFD